MQTLSVAFNNINLVKPTAGYDYCLMDFTDNSPKLRGENTPIALTDGENFVPKLKGNKLVNLNMTTNDENSLNYLQAIFYNDGTLKLFAWRGKTYQAECTDFRYSCSAGDLIKISVEITIPNPTQYS